MKAAIQLVLIYFGILQVVAPLLVMIPCAIYMLATTGTVDRAALTQMIVIPAQLTGILLMAVYLWKAGYISKKRVTWSIVSPSCMGLGVLMLFAAVALISLLMSWLTWLPNIMEDVFDILQSGWIGMLTIAVIGPVLEELLFRGAITKVLLQKYDPWKAILISAFLFGIFHINPVQVLPAFLLGILFAWIYYRTASLVPCILMHVLNNSLAVFINVKYPDVENVDKVVGVPVQLVIVVISAVVLVVCCRSMKRKTTAYPWKKGERVEILTNND